MLKRPSFIFYNHSKRKYRKGLASAIAIALLLAAAVVFIWLREPLETPPPAELLEVPSVAKPKEEYDVIVAGTDPEGVAAAVSAARNGQSVLLVDGRNRDRLGGLMTLGWLNSLDPSYSPKKALLPGKHNFLNKGIFQQWYDRVEGTSFDIITAANAFRNLVANENRIDVLLKTQSMRPLVDHTSETRTVRGLSITLADGTSMSVQAKAVIDATQDADIADIAGVPFTYGREDLGEKDSKMAVTAVFRLANVTPDVWGKMIAREGVGHDGHSAWGYHDMWDYPTTDKTKVRMRGLNIGRQNDHSILINALQLFGVDPFDPKSVEQAYETARRELPLVVDYMKDKYPEFQQVELAGIAPELYVRETRHMIGEYRLSIADLLDNRDHWDRIGFGSYSVDIQSTSYDFRGTILMKPKQYAIPFRSIVPKEVDGLLVVGRSASYDSLPHGSARTIPVGMAAGQAAGAAAKLAAEHKLTFRQLSASTTLIEQLQRLLNDQGMELKPFRIDPPAYAKHDAYPGLKAAVSMGFAFGGSRNDFELEDASNPQRLVHTMLQVHQVHAGAFKGNPSEALEGIGEPDTAPLTLEQATFTIALSAGLPTSPEQARSMLGTKQLLSAETMTTIKNPQKLTNADVYMMIRDVVKGMTGTVYE
ncbi:FAD-dependent oxidoreductase [Paenibacillus sp. GCM10012303]|uniref:FAD-dependent oxidoreductase n=1 Tax=Paenibacillus sp. GCM10012303 TaxID=3317340 RepID=UPI00361468A8